MLIAIFCILFLILIILVFIFIALIVLATNMQKVIECLNGIFNKIETFKNEFHDWRHFDDK